MSAEASVEERERLEGEREVPERDDDAADEDAAVLSEEAIGDDAAEDGGAPDAAGVGPVDRRRVGVREAESAFGRRRHHVQNQERPHPVVAEPLPHLGEEERREPTWVAEECRGRLRSRRRSWRKAYVSPRSVPQWQGVVLLVSTYDLGRQPFGLASAAAALRAAGLDVECVDCRERAAGRRHDPPRQRRRVLSPDAHRHAACHAGDRSRARPQSGRAAGGLRPVRATQRRAPARARRLGREGGEFEDGLVSALDRTAGPATGPRSIALMCLVSASASPIARDYRR